MSIGTLILIGITVRLLGDLFGRSPQLHEALS